MQPHQRRVIDEKAELDGRAAKLDDFCISDTFMTLPVVEKRLLIKQLNAMLAYSEILEDRISLF